MLIFNSKHIKNKPLHFLNSTPLYERACRGQQAY